jgi:HUS1 checkpoint protein
MGDPRDGQVRETVVTQDIPIRVLSPASVEGIHEPRCREPDVHITLPNLIQLKSISERFTKLATATSTNSERGTAGAAGPGPKLILSANMHGTLRLSIATDALSISSVWTGLVNPELDPSHIEGGEDGVREHPSTRMRELGGGDMDGEEGWARVRIDGKDWGRVLSVGRLGGRVIACMYNPDNPISISGCGQTSTDSREPRFLP